MIECVLDSCTIHVRGQESGKIRVQGVRECANRGLDKMCFEKIKISIFEKKKKLDSPMEIPFSPN